MNWENLHSIYFIGIGGIGMSALARYFHSEGKRVAGYDRTETELTRSLVAEGIAVHYQDDIRLVDVQFHRKENTLVVYTPAVPSDHSELTYFRENQFTLMKRAEVLGLISRHTRCIAIAGTHGKTTTSSITAHILKDAGWNITAFLGGITANYQTNYIRSERTDYMVVEADEFDRSFLHLEPAVSIITSAEPDHLDIYGDEAHVKESFNAFAHKLRPDGKIFLREGIGLDVADIPSRSTYSASGEADYHIRELQVNNGYFEFDAVKNGMPLGRFSLGMPGRHNVENALAAIAVADYLGVETGKIKNAVRSFRGVKRRFEKITEYDGRVYIDDYAHHPTEIRACVQAARDLYPGKRITGIFQPHLYSRTRDFAEGFAESLSMLDTLILLDIYPARELPIPGVSSEMVFGRVHCADKILTNKTDLIQAVKQKLPATDILLTIGAGDIDTFIAPIKALVEETYAKA